MAQNDCSLEDCHTNLFALTDLTGIKWKKLTAQTDANVADPFKDPVLISYTNCIQSDVLSMWKRQPRNGTNKHLDAVMLPKELWIFWYGEEPSILQSLISSELTEVEDGSWDNGMSYECRTILFKALHNLIERCLMSQSFMRIGKWFVKPCNNHHLSATPERSLNNNLSMSFLFFLHGCSTVCASVDVSQQPCLYNLHPLHLNVAQHSARGVQVLLAPYGLSGLLTGRSYPDSDPRTQKFLDDWKRFYCLPKANEGMDDSSLLPSVVEVLVAGMRLQYPSSYVLVMSDTEAELMKHHHAMLHQSPSSSTVALESTAESASDATTKASGRGRQRQKSIDVKLDSTDIKLLAGRMVDKSWQDCVVASGLLMHNRDVRADSFEVKDANSSVSHTVSCEIGDPMQKNMCLCSKSQNTRSRLMNLGSNKHGKVNKMEKERVRTSNSTPYHRRSAGQVSSKMDFLMLQNSGTKLSASQGTSVPHLKNAVCGGELHSDSPHSAAPSPLTVSQTHTSLTQNIDPTMPTLSPHLPPESNSPATNPDLPKDITGNQNMQNFASNATVPEVKPPIAIKTEIVSVPMTEGLHTNPYKVELGTLRNRIVQTTSRLAKPAPLKRPILSEMFEAEDEEELQTLSFYDYNSETTSLDQGNKRYCSNSGLASDSSLLPPTAEMPGGMSNSSNSGANDPYVFSDEVDPTINRMQIRDMRNSQDEGFSKLFPRPDDSFKKENDSKNTNAEGGIYNFTDLSPSPLGRAIQPTNLMTEDDLIPNMQDLDKMFDTDDEGDLDSPQSPTQHDKPRDDQGRFNTVKTLNMGISGNFGVHQGPTSKELAWMFPTPPSAADSHCSEPSPMQCSEYITDSVMSALDSHHSTHLANACLITTEEESSSSAHLLERCPVYVTPTICLFPRSKDYDMIDLPSKKLEPLTSAAGLIYYPSHLNTSYAARDMQPVTRFSFQGHQQPVLVNSGFSGSRIRRDSGIGFDNCMMPMSNKLPSTPRGMDFMSPPSNAPSSYNNQSFEFDQPPSVSYQNPEANSLFVNIALSDTMLNLFKDHNFDSCTICVCNMNIEGSDVGLYLPDNSNEDQYRCYCAFSAVANRRNGVNSGLFYEDEVAITGVRHNRFEKRKPSLLELPKGQGSTFNDGGVSQEIMMLLQDQFSNIHPSFIVSATRKGTKMLMDTSSDSASNLQFKDCREACNTVLEFSRRMADGCNQTRLDEKSASLHKWPFLQESAKLPTNSRDVVRLLKSLQPILQDAIQKKRTTKLWESVYMVSGPLTWKDFHLMAGRGSEETSEPKPVPSILVGYNKEWMSLSPQVIKYWDKLMLEPYDQTRDVSYVVLAFENDHIISQTLSFFKELSVMYEQCRLGKHRPLNSKLRDGIMRVGKNTFTMLGDKPIDDWFKDIGNSAIAVKLRLYAQVCRNLLAELIKQCLNEKLKAQEEAKLSGASSGSYQRFQQKQQHQSSDQSSSSSSALPQSSSFQMSSNTGIDNQSGNSVNQSEKIGDGPEVLGQNSMAKDALSPGQESEQEHGETSNTVGVEADSDCPFIVLYIVDPFSFGVEGNEASRLAMIGILRCYQEMLKVLPEDLQNRIHLQIIPLQNLLDFRSVSRSHFLMNMCFSVYTGCNRVLSHSIPGRSLTNFGPVAAAEKILEVPDFIKSTSAILYTPPFVLAPPVSAAPMEPTDPSVVLLCAYCLSEDQRWLLATCTDSCGELLETCCISIDVPNRSQRKKAKVRKHALMKLWDFILGVMSGTTVSWRLVIGRFGRLGHGELLTWSGLLSRKQLLLVSRQLRRMCRTCNVLPGGTQVPCVLSACLVSLELHPSIHVMIDSIKREDPTKPPISTPHDASCTHILVFPTSAAAQAASIPNNLPEGFVEGDILPDINEEDIGDDLHGDEIYDLFGSTFADCQPGSPKNSGAPWSPNAGQDDRHMMGDSNRGRLVGMMADQDDLQHQPLAMGFYVSTAPPGPLPRWFWTSNPQRENWCPVCFKASLHIHCPNVQQSQDELLHHVPNHKQSHAMDSSLTTDVLRYVLETYNALSWLTIDPDTSDRQSCLPAHMMVLMQLYHAMNTFV